MSQFDEKNITKAVIDRLGECRDPRFKQVMSSLVTHLHDFVRDVKLTEQEWITAIQFLTDVGKTCTDKRQEFILLSDTLGVSILVISLNHPAERGSVESTVLGPYYWEGAPERPLGSDLAEGVKGEPTFYSGRVLAADGGPIAGAVLDIWSGDGEGNYDMQIPGETEMRARQDSHGRPRPLLVPFHPAELLPGPDRWARRANATSDGQAPVPPGSHSHDRLRPGLRARHHAPVRRR